MVELMIVVAVVSVLASIIIPKMTGTRYNAKLRSCVTNIRHIVIAAQTFSNENNGVYPNTGWINQAHNLVSGGYLKSAPICPARIGSGDSYYFGPSGAYPGDYYILCSNPSGQWHPSCPNNRPVIWMGHGLSLI